MADGDKRQELIEAAGPLFAEKGVHGTGVRAIVDRAGASLSSVNYHFGGKAGLYEACLEYVIKEKMKLREIFAEVENSRIHNPDEVPLLLRKLIRDLFFTCLNPENPEWYGQLIARSQVELHPRSEYNLEKFPGPVNLRDFLKKHITGISEEDAAFWVYSLVAQVQYFGTYREAVLLTFHKENYDAGFIESVAEFTANSLLKTLGFSV